LGHDEWDTTVVTSIKRTTPCYKHGVRPTWKIVSVGGTPTRTFREARAAIGKLDHSKPTFELVFEPCVPLHIDDFFPGITHDPKSMMLSRDDDDDYSGHRVVVGGHEMTEGVHAWNVTVVKAAPKSSIRIGVCDADDFNPNLAAGDDKFAWAFDIQGFSMHNSSKSVSGQSESGGVVRMPAVHANDSFTVICDMVNGLMVLDFCVTGAKQCITYVYRNMQAKEKGKRLSPIFSFGSPGQKLRVTKATSWPALAPKGL